MVTIFMGSHVTLDDLTSTLTTQGDILRRWKWITKTSAGTSGYFLKTLVVQEQMFHGERYQVMLKITRKLYIWTSYLRLDLQTVSKTYMLRTQNMVRGS